MNTYKTTARLVGALFLIAMVGSLVGGIGFVEPAINAPDFLTTIPENETRLIIGVLLELANGLAVVGIGILMFPILKEHNEHTAVGYLAFRIIESVFCCMIVVNPLSLITLSREYAQTGAADVAYLQAIRTLSIAERNGVASLLIPVFLGLGGLLLYSALYQSKRLPNFITVWGFISIVLMLILNLLLTFNIDVGNVGMILVLPLILNEIFLGVWLIVKGFNAPSQSK